MSNPNKKKLYCIDLNPEENKKVYIRANKNQVQYLHELLENIRDCDITYHHQILIREMYIEYTLITITEEQYFND